MLRSILAFFKDPPTATALDDVALGVNVVEGIVKVAEPLRSPVRGQNCVGYFYRSFLVIPPGGRSPMPTIHKLKEAEVYGPFTLEMQGGTLEIVPARPGKFTREQHQELARQYVKDFQAIEDLILPGARVRLRGKVRLLSDGRKTMTMNSVTVLAKQVVSAGVVGSRKERRKRKE